MTTITVSSTRRIDWARLVENLQRCGMSHADIAREVDVSRQTVQSYTDDRCIEPAFWVGSSLLVLWATKTGVSWLQAPVRTVQPSVSSVLRTSA